MRTSLLLFCFCVATLAVAQKKNAAFRLHMHKASSPITIDGVLDEQAWTDAEVATNFFMMLPMDTSRSRARTDVRMTYDNKNLYLIAVCYQVVPGPNYVESLRRDFAFGKNDNFLLFMDSFDDLTSGYSFGANAAGAQWDGAMYEGGKVDLAWDNKWKSAVKSDAEKWVWEAAIPFTSIRYKKGITEWGINFSRLDLKAAEKSAWAPVPRQFPSAALAYTGTLVWDAPPPPAGVNISLIPYALGGISKDYENHSKATYRKDIGADAKIALTSSLNLDLTVNPDFSQVEVDQQVTNLDRYELFFPEKRQFFLENGDLFANFGYGSIRPFFSRRIGLNAPIRFGARLSGKPNKDWRLGAMNMQTGDVSATDLPAQNFTVASVQRRVGARSNIGVIFINKESLHYTPVPDSTKPEYSMYNRNLGAEYNLASSNNLWTGKVLALKSFTPKIKDHDFVQAAHLQYLSRHWLLYWQHEYVGRNYNAEVGYVPRRGYIKFNPQAGYLFFPKQGPVLSHGPKLTYIMFNNERLKRTDDEVYGEYDVAFRNQATLVGWMAHDYVELLQAFDPTNFTKDTLARGTQHRWYSYGLNYTSKPQSVFTYAFTSRYGGYYADGTRLNLSAAIGYRFQPFVSITMNANYNDIKLPQPWGQHHFWLIGPRFDITFTNKLYLTTFIQYNEQQKNMNVNGRLQWRYKPVSDFFLVYTDNYLPPYFNVRNRALVLKWTYWWNM